MPGPGGNGLCGNGICRPWPPTFSHNPPLGRPQFALPPAQPAGNFCGNTGVGNLPDSCSLATPDGYTPQPADVGQSPNPVGPCTPITD